MTEYTGSSWGTDEDGNTGFDLRDAALAKIKAELLRADMAGEKPQWTAIRKGLPSVSRSTFYNWINLARDDRIPKGVQSKRDAINVAAEMSRHLPAPMPPALAENMPRLTADADWLARAEELWADTRMLKDFAMKEETVRDENGEPVRKRGRVVTKRVIKNASVFNSSIDRAIQLMATAARIYDRFTGYDRIERYYRTLDYIILEEVAPLDPEVAIRILRRIELADAKYMMTTAASPI